MIKRRINSTRNAQTIVFGGAGGAKAYRFSPVKKYYSGIILDNLSSAFKL